MGVRENSIALPQEKHAVLSTSMYAEQTCCDDSV